MFEIDLHKSFIKSFEKLDFDLKTKIFEFLELLKKSQNVNNLTNIKKLTWYKWFYRYRLWDYRIWFYLEDNNIKILVIKSRWDFYKIFPKNYL